MSIAHNQGSGPLTRGGSPTFTLSLPALPAAGDLVVVRFSAYNNVNNILGVVDNQGNTYINAVDANAYGSINSVHMWYALNIGTPSGTFTVTVTGNYTGDWAGTIDSYTGVAAAAALLDVGTAQSTAPGPAQANVATAGAAANVGDLVVAAANPCQGSQSNMGIVPPAAVGYTNVGVYQNYTSINSISSDDKVATAAGAQSAAWTHIDLSTNGSWGALIAVFKAAGGGTPVSQARAAPWEARGYLPKTQTGLWESRRAIAQARTGPWEARLSILQARSPAWESRRSILQGRLDAWESLQSLHPSLTVHWESLGLLAVSQTVVMPWESIRALAATLAPNWESLQTLLQARPAPWENSLGVRLAVAVPWEGLKGLSPSQVALWESLGLLAVSQTKVSPWESLQGLPSSRVALWESLGLAGPLLPPVLVVVDHSGHVYVVSHRSVARYGAADHSHPWLEVT